MSELDRPQPTHAEAHGWAAEQSPGYLLWHLQNLWQRRQKEALEPFGLTPVQFLLLSGAVAAHAEAGAASQVALARRCRTDAMMTSQVVRTLAKAGLVRRVRDRADRRAFAVAPSEEGIARAGAAEVAVRRVEEAFFAALGPDVPAFTDALRLLGGERPRRRVRAVTRSS